MVILFLVPVAKAPVAAMYGGSNFVLHLVAPLLAAAAYLLFEQPNRLGAKQLVWCALPTLAYEVYYGVNALTHAQGGQVPLAYDWYHFLQGGAQTAIVIAPLFLLVTFVIAYALNRLAR